MQVSVSNWFQVNFESRALIRFWITFKLMAHLKCINYFFKICIVKVVFLPNLYLKITFETFYMPSLKLIYYIF